MKRNSFLTVLFFLGGGVLQGQSAAPKNRFEAASVRPAAKRSPGETGPFGLLNGGPGSASPERIDYRAVTLRSLVQKAFDTTDVQIVAPEWTRTERYDIVATLRPGATLHDLRAMIEDLLVDRFAMIFHRDTKEFAAHTLIRAPGAVKMKSSEKPLDYIGTQPGSNGHKVRAIGATLPTLARMLQSLYYNGELVIDQTGLSGFFDFYTEFASLTINPSVEPGLPSLNTALNQDLGLQIKTGRAIAGVIVIDRINTVPTEN